MILPLMDMMQFGNIVNSMAAINDVSRECAEMLMEYNFNGKPVN